MPPLGGGLRGCIGYPILCGRGNTGICLLSSFLLFKTTYVKYLTTFWCMFFVRVFHTGFANTRVSTGYVQISHRSLEPVRLPKFTLRQYIGSIQTSDPGDFWT